MANEMMLRRLSTAAALSLALVALAGCNKFDLDHKIPWGKGADGEIARPMKVVAMWTDTVLTQADKPPTRGFGGRLMFYSQLSGEEPVKVRGTLVVYAFEEDNRDPTNSVPDRKYVFTPDQFEQHYSESSLGHSYSVWLPWDPAGGPQSEISLLVRFVPEDGGGVVISEQARQLLPGPLLPEHIAQRNSRIEEARRARKLPPVRQVAYEEAIPPEMAVIESAQVEEPPRMSTTTINLPPNFSSRAPVPELQTRWPREAHAAPTMPAQPADTRATAPPAAQPAVQPSAHFGSGRSRVLGQSIARLSRDRDRWPPSHAQSPSAAELPLAAGRVSGYPVSH